MHVERKREVIFVLEDCQLTRIELLLREGQPTMDATMGVKLRGWILCCRALRAILACL